MNDGLLSFLLANAASFIGFFLFFVEKIAPLKSDGVFLTFPL